MDKDVKLDKGMEEDVKATGENVELESVGGKSLSDKGDVLENGGMMDVKLERGEEEDVKGNW